MLIERQIQQQIEAAFQESYPSSTIQVIEPGNVWDLAGVKGGNA